MASNSMEQGRNQGQVSQDVTRRSPRRMTAELLAWCRASAEREAARANTENALPQAAQLVQQQVVAAGHSQALVQTLYSGNRRVNGQEPVNDQQKTNGQIEANSQTQVNGQPHARRSALMELQPNNPASVVSEAHRVEEMNPMSIPEQFKGDVAIPEPRKNVYVPPQKRYMGNLGVPPNPQALPPTGLLPVYQYEAIKGFCDKPRKNVADLDDNWRKKE